MWFLQGTMEWFFRPIITLPIGLFLAVLTIAYVHDITMWARNLGCSHENARGVALVAIDWAFCLPTLMGMLYWKIRGYVIFPRHF